MKCWHGARAPSHAYCQWHHQLRLCSFVSWIHQATQTAVTPVIPIIPASDQLGNRPSCTGYSRLQPFMGPASARASNASQPGVVARCPTASRTRLPACIVPPPPRPQAPGTRPFAPSMPTAAACRTHTNNTHRGLLETLWAAVSTKGAALGASGHPVPSLEHHHHPFRGARRPTAAAMHLAKARAALVAVAILCVTLTAGALLRYAPNGAVTANPHGAGRCIVLQQQLPIGHTSTHARAPCACVTALQRALAATATARH